ncbi:hypothetical protein SAMN04487977_101476 [Treponema bryantii]|uniref:Phage head morphogenesis protein, SPP1 gp7 family n=1 Tax=Treponema bryantii TaxID=163 RepID=A0A1H9AUG6_9SPIR|nr:hypothetical protein [Treponema bryantii]SEP80442.1 hypothetical protein SAMN04487977_101476 [Treponema bryantii]
MNKLENGVIKYAIDFEKYKNGQANEIIKLFDDADKEIAKYLKRTSEVSTKKRYHDIAKKLREVSKEVKKNVADNTDIDGLIDYELKKQKHLLELSKPYMRSIKKGNKVNLIYPTVEQIKTAVMFKPVTDGFTYDSYLNGIEDGLFNTWDSAVRAGYLTGMPTDEIVKNVMGGLTPSSKLKKPGAINSLRNSIYGNTRTLLQSFANETRNRVFEENEQYFGDGETEYKYEYLATLDSRTCIVCGNDDGKLFKSLKDAPLLPRHRGCRCIIIPYFYIEGETRASKDGYVERVTFNDWLGKQDEETQKEVLGKTRYELYKRDKNVGQFIDDGKTISLKTMSSRIGGVINGGKVGKLMSELSDKKVEQLTNKLKVFAEEVVIPSDTEVDVVKRTIDEYTRLQSKYPIPVIKSIEFKSLPKGETGKTYGDILYIEKQMSKKITPTPSEWAVMCKSDIEHYKKQIAYCDEHIKEPLMKLQKEYFTDLLREAEYKSKFMRGNVGYRQLSVESTVTHEYGHLLSDFRIGLNNFGYFTRGKTKQQIASMLEEVGKVNDMFKSLKDTAVMKNLISEYGNRNAFEFFAEVFTMYRMGIEKLPTDIVKMIEGVIYYETK